MSLSILITIGGIIASVATAFAIVKTKVARMDVVLDELSSEIRAVREEANRMYSDHGVKIAVIENNLKTQEKELIEIKSDVKTIMSNVQDIKEVLVAVSKARKGGE